MTKRTIVLSLLENAGERGVTTGQFLRAGAGSRFGARIQELRDEGHEIHCEIVRPGSYRYTLDTGRSLSPLPSGAPSGVGDNSDSRRLFDDNSGAREFAWVRGWDGKWSFEEWDWDAWGRVKEPESRAKAA